MSNLTALQKAQATKDAGVIAAEAEHYARCAASQLEFDDRAKAEEYARTAARYADSAQECAARSGTPTARRYAEKAAYARSTAVAVLRLLDPAQ